MTLFMAKSVISIFFLLLTVIAAFTMFEILGRSEKRFNADRLKKVHRTNGIVFFLTFLLLAGMGMAYIIRTGTELSPRGTFHVMLAHAVLFFFLFKLSIIKVYRQFYGKVPAIGIIIVFLVLGTAASSTGYHILSTVFGPKGSRGVTALNGTEGGGKKTLWIEEMSIGKGRELFATHCLSCHDINSDAESGSPGLKGIMKRQLLPSSGRSVTVKNLIRQLKEPYGLMPAFPNLTLEEVDSLIAYMNVL